MPGRASASVSAAAADAPRLPFGPAAGRGGCGAAPLPLLGGDVHAVLDDNGQGHLADFAGGGPGHAGAGQPVKGHAGELLNHGAADVLGAHVGGAPGGLEGLLEGIDAVVAVGGELVRGLAEALVVLGDEADGLLIGGVGGEGGQDHDALGEAEVEVGHGQDAVHAVHAEEGRLIAHGVGLGEDD